MYMKRKIEYTWHYIVQVHFCNMHHQRNVKIWIGVPWGDQLALMTIFSFLNQFEFLFTRDFKYVV